MQEHLKLVTEPRVENGQVLQVLKTGILGLPLVTSAVSPNVQLPS